MKCILHGFQVAWNFGASWIFAPFNYSWLNIINYLVIKNVVFVNKFPNRRLVKE